jgi:hypothetical protein
VQRLDRRNIDISNAHADRGKIREKSVDAPCQVAPDLLLKVAMRRRAVTDFQVRREELILGAKCPDVNTKIHGVRRLDCLRRGQRLGDADGIGMPRNLAKITQLMLQQLNQRQPCHAAHLAQIAWIE